MCDQGIDFDGALLFQEPSRAGDGVGGVCQVVDEDCGAAGDVADEHHCSFLFVFYAGGPSFLDVWKGQG